MPTVVRWYDVRLDRVTGGVVFPGDLLINEMQKKINWMNANNNNFLKYKEVEIFDSVRIEINQIIAQINGVSLLTTRENKNKHIANIMSLLPVWQK